MFSLNEPVTSLNDNYTYIQRKVKNLQVAARLRFTEDYE